mgnify:CR=1 FL=1
MAINDLTSPAMLAHLLKYDSAQAATPWPIVTAGEDSITVDGKTIKIYAEKDAKDLPWGEIGVDVVLECTGFYTSKAKSQAHIDAGAKKVVISAPAGNDLKTIVYSVNEKTLTAEDQIISAASCTTNCLAPWLTPEQVRSHPERHYDHCARLHRRPDGSGRPPSQGRPAPRSRCRCEHCSQQHRRCQGYRPGHPRAQRQADRSASVCPFPLAPPPSWWLLSRARTSPRKASTPL